MIIATKIHSAHPIAIDSIGIMNKAKGTTNLSIAFII